MSDQKVEIIDEVTVRFAGDSGDGMQLAGSQFTNNTALAGHDLSTLPDYPAEIRAPAGTVFGVSGFQIHYSSSEIKTPGDAPDVLVAMNPAALRVNLPELKSSATIIVNTSSFDNKHLKLAGYESNPLEDDTLKGFNVIHVPMTQLTQDALEKVAISTKERERSKNFFALGLTFWLFSRDLTPTLDWIDAKFDGKPKLQEANKRALRAGYHFGEMKEIFSTRYVVEKAKLKKGKYRNVSGNEATALGFVAAAMKAKLELFLGSYPITPASEILQELSALKRFGVKTFQAEDEIAAICATIGASFTGALAITTTSGPGLALKTEATGLGVMTELPLVIVDVQRGGPSTGLPTKTEQADLLQALYGRNGEAPVCVLAAATPADCFYMAIEASRFALKYMTPVILLTDGYLANGSEPFRIPDESEIPEFPVEFRTDPKDFQPYARDINLSRPWAVPGTKGLEHRLGGLEKSHIYGNVSHVPENHEFMVRLREEKIMNIQQDIPDLEIEYDQDADVLVLTWGSSFGAATEAIRRIRKSGKKIAHAHLRYIFPTPKNMKDVLERFKTVVIPELNLGQLARVIRSEFLIEPKQINKVQGLPFKAIEIETELNKILGEQ
jgi:2-oxoglutarate/2-oxoacid ferredoxin oxidoreductase subunit alpha